MSLQGLQPIVDTLDGAANLGLREWQLKEPLDFLRDFRLCPVSLVPEPVRILLHWRRASPLANSNVGLDRRGAARNRVAIGTETETQLIAFLKSSGCRKRPGSSTCSTTVHRRLRPMNQPFARRTRNRRRASGKRDTAVDKSPTTFPARTSPMTSLRRKRFVTAAARSRKSAKT